MPTSLAPTLASVTSGAALPLAPELASVVAPPRTGGRGGLETAAALAKLADAFLEIARKSGLLTPAPRTTPRPRACDAGYAAPAKKAGAASSATAREAGPLAFLDDGKLSVEEKLMRLLAYLSAKWDKDLEKKMKEFETGQQPAAPGAAPKKKRGGLVGSLGPIVKGASGFFPAVGFAMEALRNPAIRSVLTKVGGPVLAAGATALGFPQLAPALLAYGPAVIDVAAGVATSLDPRSTAAEPASGASTAPAASRPSETGVNDRQMQLKLMEIQRIRDLQKEMFSMVSNILRSGHEARMAVIQNIR